MTLTQLNHFKNMQPNQTITIHQVKDPNKLIQAAKDYIEQYGDMELNQDHTQVTKLNPIPTHDQITFYFG